MDIKVVILTEKQFLEHLRDGLNHLYDPDRLPRNPLAVLFGVANRYDTPAALRRILTEAIQSLEPPPDEPPQSHAWRMYYALLYLYVERLTQHQAADQLAISPRQLRREQQAALRALADLLWEQFGPQEGLPGDAGLLSGQSARGDSTIAQELAWIQSPSPERQTDLGQTLPAVLDLAQRLAIRHATCLQINLAPAFPKLAVHPVAVRQILLNLFSVVIPRASGGQVQFSARPLRWEVEFRIGCTAYPAGLKPALEDETASLNIAHELARLCGGKLALSVDARAFDATLILTALEQLPVLVLDDNADTLQLLQRYTAGTRYRLITTQDPQQALEMAERYSPQIIVLDVMMPRADGWEVLARLRQHPLTGHIPIVVCTILAQKELAFFLGASAFVRKPVMQQCFLSTLDQQVERMASESR